MKPERQSVCKRTRSRSKQTSLLDFDGSKKRPVTAVAAPTAAESSDESPPSAKAAVTTSKKRGVASSSRTSKRNEPSEKKQPPLASRGRTKKRTTAAEINAEAEAEPPIQPKATSNKRRRVAKTAAASSASRKQPPERDEEEPSASTATANASPATKKKSKTRSAVCKQHTGVKPASKPPGKKSAEQRSKRVKQRPSKQGAKQHQSAITPSPDLLARKMAHQKNAAALELSDISSGDDELMVTTPLQKIGEHKKKGEDGYRGDDEVADSSSNSLSMNRSVTIDPLDLSSIKLKGSSSPPSQPSAPAFHQPWMQPYTPCLPPTSSTNSVASLAKPLSSLPNGVIDIDHFPHHCCSHSLQSHGGYSWLTSKRRCGCARDSNHCSGETLTEAYLGTYGAERYGGSVGMAATAGVEAGGTDDWKAEQWWLDQIREESERLGVEEDWRIPSPTCTLSDASSISESPPRTGKTSSKSQLSRQFPQSMIDHLDYMTRQPHITVEMRKILMDWLLEVAEEYKLSTETFWLAVTLVDRSLACSYETKEEDKKKTKGKKIKKIESKGSIGGGMVVQKDKLQLVGCACTLIASKLIEITPPTPDDFVYISDKTYTREEILEMEALVCNTLKFQLNFHTSFHYVDRFLRASYASSESSTTPTLSLQSPHSAATGCITNSSGMNNANNVLMRKLVFYLLDLAVLEYKLVSKKPSLVAASAVYLARVTLGIREPSVTTSSPTLFDSDQLQRALKGHWSKTLEYYSGYDLWDLEETVRLLHQLQETAEDNSSTLSSIFNKHKGSKCKKVALKTAVSEADLGFF